MSKKCISIMVLCAFLYPLVAGCMKTTTVYQSEINVESTECCVYEVILTNEEIYQFEKPGGHFNTVPYLIIGTLNDGRKFFRAGKAPPHYPPWLRIHSTSRIPGGSVVQQILPVGLEILHLHMGSLSAQPVWLLISWRMPGMSESRILCSSFVVEVCIFEFLLRPSSPLQIKIDRMDYFGRG